MPRPHPMTSEESERDVELRHLVFIKHVININGANAQAYNFMHVSSNHNFATATTPTSISSQKIIFSKILVGIDGSDESMHAADYALSLSNEYNAELYALHVIRSDVDLFGSHETSEYMTGMRNKGKKYLDKVRLKANEKNIQTKTEIISSINIAGRIVGYAESNNVNLIVVGTRGLSGFKKLLLGSNAAHVITYAHCTVLVVK